MVVAVSYLVECDGCQAAFITAGQIKVADALLYIGSRGWTVLGFGGDIRTLCPRCSRENGSGNHLAAVTAARSTAGPTPPTLPDLMKETDQ